MIVRLASGAGFVVEHVTGWWWGSVGSVLEGPFERCLIVQSGAGARFSVGPKDVPGAEAVAAFLERELGPAAEINPEGT